MIKSVEGNLPDSLAVAFVNTVSKVGIVGKRCHSNRCFLLILNHTVMLPHKAIGH